MSTTTTPPLAPRGTGRGGSDGALRSRVVVILVALVIGTLISAGLGMWHPQPDAAANDGFAYDTVAEMRDAWWAWHIVGSIGTAVSVLAGSLAVVLLAPRRGAAWATAGAVVTSLGALAFVAGASAEGVVFAYATDPDALPVDTGRAFVDFLNDEPGRVVAIILPGFLLMTLGALLLAAALWRAGTVPRWLPVAFGVTNIAGFVAPWGAASTVVGLVFTATVLAIGWFLWRSVAAASPTPAVGPSPATAGRATAT